MSKIFLIGDTHIGLGYPNKSDKWFSVHKEYFSDFLIPLLKRKYRKGDIIVHLGDLFDNRNIVPINLLNYGMDVVEEISKIGPLHLIIGNHDLWSKSASEINSIRPFRFIPNVFIYDKPGILEFNGINILMMPYIENRLDQIEVMREFKHCDYLFCHSDLNGCKMHLTSVAHKNSDKIDLEDFRSFRLVRSGHIHIVQQNKNFSFVGSIFQMDRNDIGDQKGIFVIDTKDDTEEFFPNLVSPVFKKLTIRDESDVEDLDNFKSTKDYIDLTVSNNLLINNRKLRRKLESILESGSFYSVEYIDDIVSDEDSDEDFEMNESVSEEDTISLKLDYDQIIRNYITDQKWESDDIKSGILFEFDEIIKIYKNQYKNDYDQ